MSRLCLSRHHKSDRNVSITDDQLATYPDLAIDLGAREFRYVIFGHIHSQLQSKAGIWPAYPSDLGFASVIRRRSFFLALGDARQPAREVVRIALEHACDRVPDRCCGLVGHSFWPTWPWCPIAYAPVTFGLFYRHGEALGGLLAVLVIGGRPLR